MDSLDDHHYRLSRVLLSIIGLWGYENSWFTLARRGISAILLLSVIVVQLTTFFTKKYDMERFLKVLPFIIFAIIFMLKFNTFFFKLKNIKGLTELIRSNWKSLNSKEEIKIVEKVADSGKFINIIFASCIYPAVFGFIISQFAMNPANTDSSANGSYNSFQLELEYFINEQKYGNFITLHLNIAVLVGSTVLVGTETMAITFAHHVSGLFQVVCYRVQNAFATDLLENRAADTTMIIHQRLIDAVKMHKRTLEYSEYLGSTLAGSYFLLLSLGVASLSLNLLRFAQAILEINKFKEVFISLFFVLAHFAYIFFANYMGQTIMDSSVHLFVNIYDTQWYIAPVSAQKLFLFIMHKSMKKYTFLVGGLFIPSYEGFTMLTKLSMSYFTVIYSTR